jgi:ribosomal protein S27E
MLFSKKAKEKTGGKIPRCALCGKMLPIFVTKEQVYHDAEGNVIFAYIGKECKSCHRVLCADCWTEEMAKHAPLSPGKCSACGGSLIIPMGKK